MSWSWRTFTAPAPVAHRICPVRASFRLSEARIHRRRSVRWQRPQHEAQRRPARRETGDRRLGRLARGENPCPMTTCPRGSRRPAVAPGRSTTWRSRSEVPSAPAARRARLEEWAQAPGSRVGSATARGDRCLGAQHVAHRRARPVLCEQPCDVEPARALAPPAADFDHRCPCGGLAEQDTPRTICRFRHAGRGQASTSDNTDAPR